MAINLQIDAAFGPAVDSGLIEQAIQLTLQHYSQIEAPTVTIVITGDETVQHLNQQFRGIDAPTDVLSFENQPDDGFPAFDQENLGEVIIALPTARKQALAAGHRPEEELALLAVHGTLHLLGFEHDTRDNKMKMWAAQNQIMEEVGLAHVQPTEH